MIEAHGWHFPDGESHLPGWIAREGYKNVMNGRASYQGHKLRATVELCRGFRTAVDVGAHVGLWSYNLAPLFGAVRAFEPVADHRACFVMNVPQQNVVLYPLALGAADGVARMRTNPTSSGDTYIDPAIGLDADADAMDDVVRVVTLDSFEFTDVDCIKVDCEGFEERVLRGARETILRTRPVICVEQKRGMATKFGMRPLGGVEFLQSLGYAIAREISGDFIMAPTE